MFQRAVVACRPLGSPSASVTRLGEAMTIQVDRIDTLRTMKENHDNVPWTAGKQDTRIIRVGKLLRFLHIDEFPQVINIIKGDLSFIGPRPESINTIQFLEQALAIDKKIGNIWGEAVNFSRLGNVFHIVGLFSEAAYHFAKAIDICRQIGDIRTEAECWSNLGLVGRAEGDINRATECYHKGIELSRKIEDRRGILADTINIGVIYLFDKKYAEAEDYFQRTV